MGAFGSVKQIMFNLVLKHYLKKRRVQLMIEKFLALKKVTQGYKTQGSLVITGLTILAGVFGMMDFETVTQILAATGTIGAMSFVSKIQRFLEKLEKLQPKEPS